MLIQQIMVGSVSELMGNHNEALEAYERALAANPNSVTAMNAASLVLRTREDFPKASEYLQRILKIEPANGEAWGSLGKQPPIRYVKFNCTWVLTVVV